MLGVLEGYTIIAVVVAAGWVVGRVGLLGPDAREVLARLVFFVLAPALLFTILASADPGRLFSPLLVASLGAALAVATLHVAVVRGWWRRPVGETTIGALGAGYVNANNIGLPVATYILGEPAAVAPVILAQLLLLAPTALAVLDASSSGNVSWRRVLTQPVRNPIILGSAAGLVVALTGVRVPDVIMEPLRILGGGAVPLMLVAFGISLAGTRLLEAGTDRRNVTLATALKLVGMPLAAWGIGTALGLDGHDLYVVVVLAALPTAQNVLNYADRYRAGQVVARDTIALTTLGALPVMAAVAVLLR